MKILIAHSTYRTRAGEDSYVDGQIDLLRERHDVDVLRPSNNELPSGAPTVVRMAYSPGFTRTVTDRIRGWAPDLVHVHNIYQALGPSVHLAAGRAGVPLVMTVHNLRLRCPNGLMFTEGSLCRRCEQGNYAHAFVHDCFPERSQSIAYGTILWSHRFVLRLEQKVTRWIAPSRFVAQRLADWGMPSDRIDVVRHWVEPHGDAEGAGEGGLFLGRLSREKGLEVLLEALATAGDPPFVIAGEGHLKYKLESMATSMRLKRVRFTGHVPRQQAADLVRRAGYLVSPSTSEETGGLAALEAMARARPVIVSNLGALPELVESLDELVVEPGSASQLAERIEWLSNDAARSRELGGELQKVVAGSYSRSAHIAALERSYANLVNRSADNQTIASESKHA